MKQRILILALGLGILMVNAPQAAAKPEEGTKPLLTFPVLSDLHVQAWNRASHTKLARALADLHTLNPAADALVLNGDLTDGRQRDYDKLSELLRQVPHPPQILSSIGNHEFYQSWHGPSSRWNKEGFPNGETEQASISRFLKFTGEKKVYYTKNIRGYDFIVLGSERYRQSDADYLEDAYLSDEQLAWLRTELQRLSLSGKPVFVFLHQPLPNSVSGTSGCCVNSRSVIQHEELKKLLAAYPQIILFSGHTHLELKLQRTLVRDGFVMVNSSSVEQPWTEDERGTGKPLGPEASEGLYVEVYASKVIIRGRDFHKQRWIPEAEFTVQVPAVTNGRSLSGGVTFAHFE
ncbi:Calcineurin-like phosphoesterase [Paenibacillus konkukensis]|uniref:Calcineurin-like phosphoesterase n=1 Tax=Paenibacillus konkukensis TaxID=2020716 RepID=A0ABY4RGA1_9BACL|nr:metallophosphoesterase [Paenibacillus konkukensis]UQZ81501.1 Calcineurin-like phosphoesterase [Paenibacillus konkukensis]